MSFLTRNGHETRKIVCDQAHVKISIANNTQTGHRFVVVTKKDRCRLLSGNIEKVIENCIVSMTYKQHRYYTMCKFDSMGDDNDGSYVYVYALNKVVNELVCLEYETRTMMESERLRMMDHIFNIVEDMALTNRVLFGLSPKTMAVAHVDGVGKLPIVIDWDNVIDVCKLEDFLWKSQTFVPYYTSVLTKRISAPKINPTKKKRKIVFEKSNINDELSFAIYVVESSAMSLITTTANVLFSHYPPKTCTESFCPESKSNRCCVPWLSVTGFSDSEKSMRSNMHRHCERIHGLLRDVKGSSDSIEALGYFRAIVTELKRVR